MKTIALRCADLASQQDVVVCGSQLLLLTIRLLLNCSYFTKLGSKSAPSQLSYQLPSLSSRVQAIAGTLERSPDAVAGVRNGSG